MYVSLCESLPCRWNRVLDQQTTIENIEFGDCSDAIGGSALKHALPGGMPSSLACRWCLWLFRDCGRRSSQENHSCLVINHSSFIAIFIFFHVVISHQIASVTCGLLRQFDRWTFIIQFEAYKPLGLAWSFAKLVIWLKTLLQAWSECESNDKSRNQSLLSILLYFYYCCVETSLDRKGAVLNHCNVWSRSALRLIRGGGSISASTINRPATIYEPAAGHQGLKSTGLITESSTDKVVESPSVAQDHLQNPSRQPAACCHQAFRPLKFTFRGKIFPRIIFQGSHSKLFWLWFQPPIWETHVIWSSLLTLEDWDNLYRWIPTMVHSCHTTIPTMTIYNKTSSTA